MVLYEIFCVLIIVDEQSYIYLQFIQTQLYIWFPTAEVYVTIDYLYQAVYSRLANLESVVESKC